MDVGSSCGDRSSDKVDGGDSSDPSEPQPVLKVQVTVFMSSAFKPQDFPKISPLRRKINCVTKSLLLLLFLMQNLKQIKDSIIYHLSPITVSFMSCLHSSSAPHSVSDSGFMKTSLTKQKVMKAVLGITMNLFRMSKNKPLKNTNF